jgi:hypothetical protein
MIIKAAARIAKQEPPQELTLEAAQKILPQGFDLDETEWNGILSNFTPEPVEFDGDPAELRHAADGGVLAHQPRIVVEPSPSAVDAPKETTVANAPSLDFNASVGRLRELQRQLAEHRGDVMKLTRLHQEKKGVLARAIEAWQSNAVTGDAETRRMAAVRDHLVAAQADRAKRMEEIPAELRGRYGPAAAFVRKQRSVPPNVDPNSLRKGQSRGAAPAAMRTLPGVRP